MRPKNGGQLDPWFLNQPVDDMAEGVVDRRVIADDTHAGPPQVMGSEQHVGPEPHRTLSDAKHSLIIERRA
jgi:hypothetical protein